MYLNSFLAYNEKVLNKNLAWRNNIMKNRKGMAIICWGISIVALLSALLRMEGDWSKYVISQIVHIP